MTGATKAKQTELEAVELPACGEWVYFYRRAITNQGPVAAVVNKDALNASAVSLTAMTESGPIPLRSVLHHSDPRLDTSKDLRDNGVWSRTRIDKGK